MPVAVIAFMVTFSVSALITSKIFGASSLSYLWLVSIATGLSVVAGSLVAPSRFQKRSVYILMAVLIVEEVGSLIWDATHMESIIHDVVDLGGIGLGFFVMVRPILKRMPISRGR
jgi:hypothetical protein